VNSDKAIYKGAIPGMLRTLDPHSNFFDPKEYQALRDDQRGHYYGVACWWERATGNRRDGLRFRDHPLIRPVCARVTSSAWVNEKVTDNLNTTEIADLLKGPRGTQVKITVVREGSTQPIAFNRDAR